MVRYPITIHPDPQGGFVAEIEDLPGCITQGETLEEVYANIEDARRSWIEVALEERLTVPPPRILREPNGDTTLRIPGGLGDVLRSAARQKGVSLEEYALEVLTTEARDEPESG